MVMLVAIQIPTAYSSLSEIEIQKYRSGSSKVLAKRHRTRKRFVRTNFQDVRLDPKKLIVAYNSSETKENFDLPMYHSKKRVYLDWKGSFLKRRNSPKFPKKLDGSETKITFRQYLDATSVEGNNFKKIQFVLESKGQRHILSVSNKHWWDD